MRYLCNKGEILCNEKSGEGEYPYGVIVRELFQPIGS